VLGALAWAQTTPGGVSGELHRLLGRARGAVEQATADPDLRRAADALDQRYARLGSYQRVDETDSKDNAALDLGVGVDVEWCGPQDVVLRSLTAQGSVSRLLLEGRDLGEVNGSPPCPADLAHPAPWKLG